MVLVLQATGALPIPGDWTADGLMHLFEPVGVEGPVPGDLAFRLNASGKAVHVGMVRFILEDGTVLVIAAGGGDDTTTTLEKAIEKNAFVKMHPVWKNAVYANPFAGIVKPGGV